jgi:hypothetical protein
MHLSFADQTTPLMAYMHSNVGLGQSVRIEVKNLNSGWVSNHSHHSNTSAHLSLFLAFTRTRIKFTLHHQHPPPSRCHPSPISLSLASRPWLLLHLQYSRRAKLNRAMPT